MKENSGFTLIELMVVVVILTILGSMVYTATHGAKFVRSLSPERNVVHDRPDLSKCEFVGLNNQDQSTYKCFDGRIYTDH